MSMCQSAKNPGRLYLKCPKRFCDFFEWVDREPRGKNKAWIKGNTNLLDPKLWEQNKEEYATRILCQLSRQAIAKQKDLQCLKRHQEYSVRAQSSEGKRTVVGYKGGHVEKDLLQKLNIPSLNLETLGCPKYDDLRSQMVPLLTRPRRSPLLSPSHPPISNPLPRDVRSEGDRGYPPLVTSRQST